MDIFALIVLLIAVVGLVFSGVAMFKEAVTIRNLTGDTAYFYASLLVAVMMVGVLIYILTTIFNSHLVFLASGITVLNRVKFDAKKITLEFGDTAKLASWEAHLKSMKGQLRHAEKIGDFELAHRLEEKINSYRKNQG